MTQIKIDSSNGYRKLVGDSKLVFLTRAGALRQSRKVTTNPSAIELHTADIHEYPVYLAAGDHWIDNNGRGQYVYGRGGKLVELIETN